MQEQVPTSSRGAPQVSLGSRKNMPLLEQLKFSTISDMDQNTMGSLQDSMWAPPHLRSLLQQSKGSALEPPKPTSTGPIMPSLCTIENKKPEPTGATIWHSETPYHEKISAWSNSPLTSAVDGHDKANWEAQPSQSVYEGEPVASSWAVQPPQNPNPNPEGATAFTLQAQQSSARPATHYPQKPQRSFVPAHLRGIDIEKEQKEAHLAPVPAQAQSSAPVSPAQKPAAAASKTVSTQDVDNVTWARKMGLLPKVPSKPTPPTQVDAEAEAWTRKLASGSKSATVKQTTTAPQSFANNSKQQNQSTSGYGQKPAQVVTTPLQTQPIKVASNAPFENTRFQLKKDNMADFEEYVRKTLKNPPAGKKYTFNGTLWAAERAKEENAKNAHAGKQAPGVPDSAPSQQRDSTTQPAGKLQEPSHVKTENKASFSKQDPNMIFSPSQLAALNTDAEKVAKVQDKPDSPRRMNTPWPTVPSPDVKHFNEKVAHELNASEKFFANIAAPLTQDALVTTTGFKPRDHSHNFEDQVSDDGVVQDNVKEGIRATQGKDAATQLLDWDGKRWAPPPCDWENDRPGFDDSFIHEYIKEWRNNVPCGPCCEVNIAAEEFTSGNHPVSNDVLIDSIEQPQSTPDIGNCEDEKKRTHQTALVEANKFIARMEKKQKKEDRYKATQNSHQAQAALAVDEPNIFSPKIKMYVRPALQKDAQDIMKIYNSYVATSIIPEDQQPISLDDSKALIDTCKREKLPFVVAVKGRLPPTQDAQGRSRANKVILPQIESIIGFAFAERFNYAFTGSVRGRSRGTATIQLYVEPTSTRKGVGRNTLDHLLHCMASAYTFKNACPWINPAGDPVHEPNGCGLIHQVLMMVPVMRKDDPNFPWLSDFLYRRFWFKEEARMRSVARSSATLRTRQMLDVAVLQYELLHEDEFDAMF